MIYSTLLVNSCKIVRITNFTLNGWCSGDLKHKLLFDSGHSPCLLGISLAKAITCVQVNRSETPKGPLKYGLLRQYTFFYEWVYSLHMSSFIWNGPVGHRLREETQRYFQTCQDTCRFLRLKTSARQIFRLWSFCLQKFCQSQVQDSLRFHCNTNQTPLIKR